MHFHCPDACISELVHISRGGSKALQSSICRSTYRGEINLGLSGNSLCKQVLWEQVRDLGVSGERLQVATQERSRMRGLRPAPIKQRRAFGSETIPATAAEQCAPAGEFWAEAAARAHHPDAAAPGLPDLRLGALLRRDRQLHQPGPGAHPGERDNAERHAPVPLLAMPR